MAKIHSFTNQTGKEVPFFLFGEERNDGTVLFDNIVIGNAISTQQASFSSITPKLEKFINYVEKNKLSKQIVCHGHTHPKSQYGDNFSLEDMAAYIIMQEIHPSMKNGTIQTVGCIFNGSGDLNFVLYDEYNKGFYKFPNVKIEYNNGERDSLPAYTKGNYNISNSR